MKAVTVFVCGEALRGDDAAARAAVVGLPPQSQHWASVRQVGALSVEDLLELGPGAKVIVVDAVVGIAPGRLVTFDLSDLPTQASRLRPHSTHQLPLDQVVGMAALLGAHVSGSFLGVGGADFAMGAPLSTPVQRAVPALRAALVAEIALLGGDSELRRSPAPA